MMRIYTKIQLILESNPDFQGFINIIQTHPEIQPAVEFGLRFLILVTLLIPRHVTICVFLSISFQFLTQRLLSCKTQQDSAYG